MVFAQPHPHSPHLRNHSHSLWLRIIRSKIAGETGKRTFFNTSNPHSLCRLPLNNESIRQQAIRRIAKSFKMHAQDLTRAARADNLQPKMRLFGSLTPIRQNSHTTTCHTSSGMWEPFPHYVAPHEHTHASDYLQYVGLMHSPQSCRSPIDLDIY